MLEIDWRSLEIGWTSSEIAVPTRESLIKYLF